VGGNAWGVEQVKGGGGKSCRPKNAIGKGIKNSGIVGNDGETKEKVEEKKGRTMKRGVTEILVTELNRKARKGGVRRGGSMK